MSERTGSDKDASEAAAADMDLGSTKRIQHQSGWAHQIELPSIHLKVTEGPDQRQSATVPVTLIRIGTDPANDLVLTDHSVSRFHLTITRSRKGLLVSDLDSTNGTWLDGVRIKEAYLDPGAIVRVGETAIRVDTRRSQHYAVPGREESFGELVGKSAAMREVYALIRAVGRTPVSVLIDGESGTGKEVVARAVHRESARQGPLVVFDCGSTSADLIRSELFGHEGGSFTGATRSRTGACRAADKGTLFLDEIGEMPLSLQPTLLRFLETREVKPLGMDNSIPLDVRMIAATNVDLEEAVEERRFRGDLYHRLKVIRIRLPPLRERKEDIPILVDHFCKVLETPMQFTEEAVERMNNYSWPGNVREIRHVLERVAITCRGRPVDAKDLDIGGRTGEGRPASAGGMSVPGGVLIAPDAGGGGSDRLKRAEIDMIKKTLRDCRGNKTEAAKALGIARSTLFRKLKEFGIEDEVPDPEGA